MLVEVKVPQLSESVAEATLVSWHRKVGDFVKRDENLVDIETDKVVLETPAPDSGVLVKIMKGDGGTVVGKEIIATIDTEAKTATAAAPAAAPAPRYIRRLRPPAGARRRRSCLPRSVSRQTTRSILRA
jgi:2-oxoglutarate dehydrogenase E2 component (dihydrolipoamide succinyltransferase)